MMILVSGLPRSGTSILSGMLHRGGVDMGMIVANTYPGAIMDPEYEEAEFALMMMNKPNKQQADKSLRQYIMHRAKTSRTLQWGVKSPYALPYVSRIKMLCEDMGIPFLYFGTMRPLDESAESLDRIGAAMHRDDKWKAYARAELAYLQPFFLDNMPTEAFLYEELRNTPHLVAQRLKNHGLLIDEQKAIHGVRATGINV